MVMYQVLRLVTLPINLTILKIILTHKTVTVGALNLVPGLATVANYIIASAGNRQLTKIDDFRYGINKVDHSFMCFCNI